MPSPQYKIDYTEFMDWFKKTYPALFEEYGDNIVLAKDDTGLKVDIHGLDQKIYNKLFDIQNEFYSLKQK